MEFNGVDFGAHETSGQRFRNQKLRRGVYLLPSAFTVANLFCGYYAILATLEGQVGDLDHAAKAIGIAMILDTLDGRVARAMGTNSEFGKEFDSLADIISFGIAPAFLAYVWGVRAAAAVYAPDWAHLMQLGWLIGFFYLVCCAWRLARFNIQGMAPGSNRFFVGMPTPAAAGAIAAVVHFFQSPITEPPLAMLWLLWVALLGLLMSSTIRHYSFKDIQWTKRRPSLAVVVIALLIGAIVKFSGPTLLIMATVYTLHGATLHFIKLVRRRVASRHA